MGAMVGASSLWFCALACLAACGAAGQRRGTPLYPEPAKPLARSEVAVLSGYVAEVDGNDVGEEDVVGSFELLPGCHVVRTPSDWTRHEGGIGLRVYGYRLRPRGRRRDGRTRRQDANLRAHAG
jgi:hypothetical protein